jgi:two-component system cell cycle sensor histidine kinase/response regulator CckA
LLKSQQIVGHLGYRADMAADGEEAVRHYRKSIKTGDPYQAVILDLIVPGAMGAMKRSGNS